MMMNTQEQASRLNGSYRSGTRNTTSRLGFIYGTLKVPGGNGFTAH